MDKGLFDEVLEELGPPFFLTIPLDTFFFLGAFFTVAVSNADRKLPNSVAGFFCESFDFPALGTFDDSFFGVEFDLPELATFDDF